MTNGAVQAVRELVAHVDAHERARQAVQGKYEPSEEEKTKREACLQKVLDELGSSKAELQNKLGIDRSTWDRWRTMSSVPHRSYLEALNRYAEEKEKDISRGGAKPAPLLMLSARPRTWGRLRLVYSLFAWQNAIFHFNKPFVDSETATEMALLSLRGCNIIYITKNPNDWANKFSSILQKVLGKTYAARALSRICVIETPNDFDDQLQEFGVFNFETPDAADSVGYIWTGEKDADRPSDVKSEVYDPIPASDDNVIDLKAIYNASVQEAMGIISKRDNGDFWSNLDHDTIHELLSIKIIMANVRSVRTAKPLTHE